MSWLRAAMLALVLVLGGAFPAFSETRVALVIANSAYRNAPRLANPANDGPAVAAALRQAGFATVTVTTDLDQQAIRSALQTFAAAARNADMAVLYFAGHGMEMGGVNYLLPVDARLASSADVTFEAVPLELAIQAVSGAQGLGIVMLDACRNNPFAATMSVGANAMRAVSRGLSRIEPRNNTLVVYAARDGTTAEDGRGANSPFAASLIRRLPAPGVEIGILFRQVRDDVMAATNDRQQPFVYGSIGGDPFYLVPAEQDREPAKRAPSVTSQSGSSETLVSIFAGFSPEVEVSVLKALRFEEQARLKASAAVGIVDAAQASAKLARAEARRAERKETGYAVILGNGGVRSGALQSWRYSGQAKNGDVFGDGSLILRSTRDDRGYADGYGVKVWIDGSREEGEWSSDLLNGYSVLTFPEGGSFVGLFERGYLAYGVEYIGWNGSQFRGEYDKGKRLIGSYIYSPVSAGAEASGQWSQAGLNGYGVLRWRDGSVSLGMWQDGELQGFGANLDPVGRIREQGLFQAGALKTPLSR